jgi:hypothetical protein
VVFIPPDLLNDKDPEQRKNMRRAGLVGCRLLLLIVLGVVVAVMVDLNRSAGRTGAGPQVLHQASGLSNHMEVPAMASFAQAYLFEDVEMTPGRFLLLVVVLAGVWLWAYWYMKRHPPRK